MSGCAPPRPDEDFLFPGLHGPGTHLTSVEGPKTPEQEEKPLAGPPAPPGTRACVRCGGRLVEGYVDPHHYDCDAWARYEMKEKLMTDYRPPETTPVAQASIPREQYGVTAEFRAQTEDEVAFIRLFEQALHTYRRKNADYGDAWKQLGCRGVFVRWFDKSRRLLRLLWDGNTAQVANESTRDTMADALLYNAMMLALYDRERS